MPGELNRRKSIHSLTRLAIQTFCWKKRTGRFRCQTGSGRPPGNSSSLPQHEGPWRCLSGRHHRVAPTAGRTAIACIFGATVGRSDVLSIVEPILGVRRKQTEGPDLWELPVPKFYVGTSLVPCPFPMRNKRSPLSATSRNSRRYSRGVLQLLRRHALHLCVARVQRTFTITAQALPRAAFVSLDRCKAFSSAKSPRRNDSTRLSWIWRPRNPRVPGWTGTELYRLAPTYRIFHRMRSFVRAEANTKKKRQGKVKMKQRKNKAGEESGGSVARV